MPAQNGAHDRALASNSFDAVLRRMMQGAAVQTQTELARLLEVGKAAISDAKRRGVIPPEWFLKLCHPPCRLNPLWLLHGQPPVRIPMPDEATEESNPQSSLETSAPANWPGSRKPGNHHPIPLVRLPANGRAALDILGPGPFACDTVWLRERSAPDSVRLLRISGHAMHPSLREGDYVLLDTSRREVLEGGVHLLRLEGQFMIKRLAKRPGTLLLISDNAPLYPQLELPHPDAGLEILGRIVWLGRDV